MLDSMMLFESVKSVSLQMKLLWKIFFIAICVLAAHLCLIYFGRKRDSFDSSKTHLIVDTDAGGDDALAILLALSVPDKIKVLAITCTYGNTWLSNVQTNVLKILTIANHFQIPVYGGADKPLIRNFTASDYFGQDGLGDFEFDQQILATVDSSKHAALAMIDLVKQYPGQVNVVSLGPTTNLALASSLDPNFSRKVKRFYVMGSSPSRVGFNFALDPESTAIFLDSVTTKTKLVTSSTAVAYQNMLTKDWRTNVLGQLNSERVRFVNKAESVVLRRQNYWTAADSIAIATILWPELVTSSVVARMSSDICNHTRGAVKFEQKAINNNVELVTGFDVTAFADKLLDHLT